MVSKLITGICDDGLIYSQIPKNFKDLKNWRFNTDLNESINNTFLIKYINGVWYLNRPLILNFINNSNNINDALLELNQMIIFDIKQLKDVKYKSLISDDNYNYIRIKISRKFDVNSNIIITSHKIIDKSCNFNISYPTNVIKDAIKNGCPDVFIGDRIDINKVEKLIDYSGDLNKPFEILGYLNSPDML